MAVHAVATVTALFLSVLPAQAAGSSPAGAGRSGAGLWRSLTALPAARAGAAPDISVLGYRAFALDRAGLRARLSDAPLELTTAARTAPLILSLPAPGRGFARFAVQESPVVAPELAARFPFVKTYSGQGIDDPAATIRLDLGRTGFHAQVLSPNGDWYIDPYYHQDQRVYVSYFGHDLLDTHGPFIKLDPEEHEQAANPAGPLEAARVVGTELRTYRLAVAADGEYSTFQGSTSASSPSGSNSSRTTTA